MKMWPDLTPAYRQAGSFPLHTVERDGAKRQRRA